MSKKDEEARHRSWYERKDDLLECLRQIHPSEGRAPEIEGYEDLHLVGRGGQGAVYMGRRLRSRRPVAVKVLRDGPWATPAGRRRFDREIELAGSLRHPGIARLLASGTTRSQQRYLVMDYVDGVPFDEFCAGESSATKILEVFLSTCETVLYAHQRGVIHRDLKPSNIRVTRDGRPYVLDFGLAKPLFDGSSQDPSSLSSTGDFLGSLPWASPEQVRGEGTDVRTDVYTLGVILYRSLTGSSPYPPSENLQETLSHITGSEPRAMRRGGRRLPQDLQGVVACCLRKKPEERYQTVHALAEDLGSFLRGEPIAMRETSLGVSLRRLWGRHRGAVSIGLGGLLVLLAISVSTTVLLRRARQAEEVALKKSEELEREKGKVEAVNEFLIGAFRPVGAGGKGESQDSEPGAWTLRDLVEGAAERVGSEPKLAERPEVRAEIHTILSYWFAAVSNLDEAEAQHRKALELREAGDSARGLHFEGIAWVRLQKGDYRAARDWSRRAYEVHQRHEAKDTQFLPSLNVLCQALAARGEFTELLPFVAELHERLVRVHGKSDPSTLAVERWADQVRIEVKKRGGEGDG